VTHEGQSFLLSNPLIATLPGLVITMAVAGEPFLGDFLRDLLDPRLKREQLEPRRASAEPDDT
jgi:peptide/nickel transport system permease protein